MSGNCTTCGAPTLWQYRQVTAFTGSSNGDGSYSVPTRLIDERCARHPRMDWKAIEGSGMLAANGQCPPHRVQEFIAGAALAVWGI